MNSMKLFCQLRPKYAVDESVLLSFYSEFGVNGGAVIFFSGLRCRCTLIQKYNTIGGNVTVSHTERAFFTNDLLSM